MRDYGTSSSEHLDGTGRTMALGDVFIYQQE